ncbi:MAG: DUF1573 domain-containing protein [Paludibacteraceae bacterium]|jgi:hypothetical protein|nr:DUF1573 domain-containing protein [Paludibacteraceae bacterium]MEE0910873.1 DUF1573 domain-containing protein [Paludibacteraceae bacterium]
MRKVLLFLFAFVGVAFVCAKPKIVFSEVEYVFTDNILGETSEHVFVFKNEGDAPLIINNAVPSCGCVTPSWTKSPVSPGDTGSVHVYYKSNMSGAFSKTIKIYSNSQGKRPVLKISGETRKSK